MDNTAEVERLQWIAWAARDLAAKWRSVAAVTGSPVTSVWANCANELTVLLEAAGPPEDQDARFVSLAREDQALAAGAAALSAGATAELSRLYRIEEQATALLARLDDQARTHRGTAAKEAISDPEYAAEQRGQVLGLEEAHTALAAVLGEVGPGRPTFEAVMAQIAQAGAIVRRLRDIQGGAG
jgi:hypothetical protein